jgi:hypothetical protein
VFCEGIQFGGVFIRQGEFPDSLNVLGGLTQEETWVKTGRCASGRDNAQLLVRTTWPVGRSYSIALSTYIRP